ncbi:MAG: S1 RNA-binding domain-containing protein [Candidatus Eremiobacterota bacterium]
MPLEVGSIVEGTITGITSFGAFVELPEGHTGLVHISEVADVFVTDVRQFVQERDTVRVKILNLNEKGKYDLSIKQAVNPEAAAMPPRFRGRQPGGRPRNRSEESGNPGFEEMLARWKKDSEERLLDVKRNTEAKRGRGRGR